jgi:hypothetical protein
LIERDAGGGIPYNDAGRDAEGGVPYNDAGDYFEKNTYYGWKLAGE